MLRRLLSLLRGGLAGGACEDAGGPAVDEVERGVHVEAPLGPRIPGEGGAIEPGVHDGVPLRAPHTRQPSGQITFDHAERAKALLLGPCGGAERAAAADQRGDVVAPGRKRTREPAADSPGGACEQHLLHASR